MCCWWMTPSCVAQLAVRSCKWPATLVHARSTWPALRRLSGNELALDANSVEDAVRMLNSLSAMSAMLR